MMSYDRRAFLRWGSIGLGALSLGAMGRLARAQAVNQQVLLTVFMRGGTDGMSMLQPVAGSSAPRQKYEAWRGAGTRIQNGIPIGGRFAMHPALAPLESLFGSRRAMLVAGVAGAQFNRSHFEQQDLVESGAGTSGGPLVDGILGRSLQALGRQDEVLSGVSLNATPPNLLRNQRTSGLAVPDFRTFGALSSSSHDEDPDFGLQQRVEQIYVPASGTCGPRAKLCENGGRAARALGDLELLRGAAGIPTTPAESLGVVLSDVAKLIAQDSEGLFKFVTLDVGGWDTHLNQGNDDLNGSNFAGALAGNLARLSGALRSLYDEATLLGIWNRITVLVITEFGRTTRQNGTGGTDHGRGSTALVLGSGLARAVNVRGYFPNNPAAAFYTEAESVNVVPSLVEHRYLFHEVLDKRLGVSGLSTVLPGYAPAGDEQTIFS